MKTVVKMVSSFFYLGFVPRIPGLFGSIGGLLFYFMARHNLALYLGSLACIAIAALLVIKKAEEIYGSKDAKPIVIDEAAGVMLALFLVPAEPAAILLAFTLFRIFDVLKPFPIRWAEGKKSPWGVILDDIIAGIYANLAVQALWSLAVKRTV